MNIEEATDILDDQLRGKIWLNSTGYGATDAGPAIFVYAKYEPTEPVADTWQGFPVIVRIVGEISAG